MLTVAAPVVRIWLGVVGRGDREVMKSAWRAGREWVGLGEEGVAVVLVLLLLVVVVVGGRRTS